MLAKASVTMLDIYPQPIERLNHAYKTTINTFVIYQVTC